MKLSRGAQKCLDLLRWYAARFRDVYPYQETIAKRLNVGERQVRRYLHELVSGGLVEVLKQGPNSASYRLLNGPTEDSGNQQVVKENVRSLSGQMSGQCPVYEPVSITESSSVLETTKQATRARGRTVEIPPLPPPTITNEYGRTERNPLRELFDREIIRALPRIQQAENPVAYEAGIIRDIYRRLSQTQPVERKVSEFRNLETPRALAIVRKPPDTAVDPYGGLGAQIAQLANAKAIRGGP